MHIVSNVVGDLSPDARRARRAVRGLPRRHRQRRAQGPRVPDHRRTRTRTARRLCRRRRLFLARRIDGFVHRAAHRGGEGRHDPRPGGRRHRRRQRSPSTNSANARRRRARSSPPRAKRSRARRQPRVRAVGAPHHEAGDAGLRRPPRPADGLPSADRRRSRSLRAAFGGPGLVGRERAAGLAAGADRRAGIRQAARDAADLIHRRGAIDPALVLRRDRAVVAELLGDAIGLVERRADDDLVVGALRAFLPARSASRCGSAAAAAPDSVCVLARRARLARQRSAGRRSGDHSGRNIDGSPCAALNVLRRRMAPC